MQQHYLIIATIVAVNVVLVASEDTPSEAYSANYLDAYPGHAQKVYPGISTANKRQDIDDIDGPMVMAILPGAFAIIGVVGVAWYIGNELDSIRSRLSSVETDQSSICTSVKTLGAIDVSDASTTDTTTGTELNDLIAAVEAASTPSCS